MTRTPFAVLLCAAALALGGCETARNLNPFAEKDPVIPGERQPVFDAGSGFEGPRKLPPPDSDYVGATMRAGEPLPPASAAPASETAPGVGASAPVGAAAPPAPSTSSAPRAEPLPVPPPPQ